MATQIGTVPLYADDETGDIFVDPSSVDGMDDDDDDDVGAIFGRKNRAKRLGKRINRLTRRAAKFAPHHEESAMSGDDAYTEAARRGLLSENQYNGLGSTTLDLDSTGTLSDSINRTIWAKSVVLSSDAPSLVLVNSISSAGVPINIGSKGAPLSMFQHDSTRFGVSFGRKLISTGQVFSVGLTNLDGSAAHVVAGSLIADELNHMIQQNLMEDMLRQAIHYQR